MAAAAQELRWLSAREEEEIAFDWSDRNAAMAAKKDAYSVSAAQLRGCAAAWLHGCGGEGRGRGWLPYGRVTRGRRGEGERGV